MIPRTHIRAGAAGALVIICSLLLLLATVLPAGAQEGAQEERAPAPVWVTEVEGIIGPPISDYLRQTMTDAREAGAEALVVMLDTPGGLDASMRQIIQAEVDSPMPVIFYVHPQGARAASAGVYLLMASDVAAMSPQTNLGSATPVSMGGDMSEEMQNKVINDAAAYIRSLAENHGRNADWAERAVREAVSLTATEAEAIGVIDFVAADLESLLEQMDGYETVSKGVTLRTAEAPIERVEMGWVDRLLHIIVDPNVAFVLMLIGVYGIIFELQNPGLGVGGIAGVISILLALYAFQVLPVSYVGLALIIVAVGLFVTEVYVQSGGLLAVGGTVALVLGGMLLFDAPESFLRVDWTVLIVAAVVTLLFFAVVIGAVARAFRRRPATGDTALVGETGLVRRRLDPGGQVLIHGEIWRAVSEEEPIDMDEEVEVVSVDGLTLRVRSRRRKEE